MQIIDVRLIQLSYSSFKLVAFQTPDWIYSPFGPRLKLAWLVEIANIHIRGEFFVHTNRQESKERKVLHVFFIASAGFLPVRQVTSLLRALTMLGILLAHAVTVGLQGRAVP